MPIFCSFINPLNISSAIEMELKLGFQMWLQKSCEKDVMHTWSLRQHLCFSKLCWSFALYTCLTLLLGFIQRFVSPLEQLCSPSHCLSSTRSHLANTTVICCFQSCVYFIAFLSGVCILQFMLIDNNQLPSFFSTRLHDFPRQQIGQTRAPHPPVLLPARGIHHHLVLQATLSLLATRADQCRTDWGVAKCSTRLYFICHVCFID